MMYYCETMPSSYQVNEMPVYITLQNATLPGSAEYFDFSDAGTASNEINSGLSLSIIEQPEEIFRFRYGSECKKGSHGAIKGKNSEPAKKSFPTVKLENCPSDKRKKIIVQVSLYTDEPTPKPHVYQLAGKSCSEGKCKATLDENFMVIFDSISVSSLKREEIFQVLKQKKISEYNSNGISFDEAALKEAINKEIKQMKLDSARLCFEAFCVDDMATPLCTVFSNPICNEKSAVSGDLTIVRLSHWSGKCSGGDEVILLCEKVNKGDIQVRLFEKQNDVLVWEDYGMFSPAEVHHQLAITFKTPQYRNRVGGKVSIELRRPSGGKPSASCQFEYIPDKSGILQFSSTLAKNECCEIARKRKKTNLGGLDEPTTSTHDLVNDVDLFKDFSMEELEELCPRLLIDLDIPATANMQDPFEYSYSATGEEGVDGSFPYCSMPMAYQCMRPPENDPQMCPVAQMSVAMDSLSLVDQSCTKELNPSKMQKTSKNFIDGIKTLLQSRKETTYLHYAPSLIPMEDENGNSMLHLAILEQNENWDLILKVLKMASQDVINHQNKFQETPLHLAVKGNHLKILFLLLAKGGDPNIQDKDGNNCLHITANYVYSDCLKMLMSPEIMRKCKLKITDIDSLNHDGMSALHIAVTRNSQSCVHFLLNSGADVNLQERKCGRTSLHLAIEHPSLLQIILNRPELDIDAKDFRGYTAVRLACLKTGKSFEDVSEYLEDSRDKTIEFLENIYQNDIECDSACSNGESTESSDFEEFCNDDACETTPDEMKTCLMKSEEELRKYLDVNENWKKLAVFIGLDAECVAILEKGCCPGMTVWKKTKDLYKLCDLQSIIQILRSAGLEEGLQILQKTP